MPLSYEEFVNEMGKRCRTDTHLLRLLSTFDWNSDDYEDCLYFDLIYTINCYSRNETDEYKVMDIYERMLADVIRNGYGHILDRLVIHRDRLFKFWYIKIIMPNA
uniref:Uncharacterized protein n=1 Tax=viral metagenome TaxID=1070528 RepID=A0A6C0BR04_9ZZZZ